MQRARRQLTTLGYLLCVLSALSVSNLWLRPSGRALATAPQCFKKRPCELAGIGRAYDASIPSLVFRESPTRDGPTGNQLVCRPTVILLTCVPMVVYTVTQYTYSLEAVVRVGGGLFPEARRRLPGAICCADGFSGEVSAPLFGLASVPQGMAPGLFFDNLAISTMVA